MAQTPATTNPKGASHTGAKAIVPVMFAFFVMGFVDLVGTATNYVKPEFNLSDTQPRFPVQLLEAGMNFVLCIILLQLSKKEKMWNGRTMGIYLIYYSIARFGLEMLRGDKIRGGISLFSTSQLISILLLPIGIILLHGKWTEKYCKDS